MCGGCAEGEGGGCTEGVRRVMEKNIGLALGEGGGCVEGEGGGCMEGVRKK